MANLSTLPPELARIVLTQLDDPDDLVSAVNASSSFYRSIQIFPWHILVDILSREITPLGLPHALALTHFTTTKNNKDLPQEAIDLATIQFPEDTATLLAMWRTHMVVSAHIKDYALSALCEVKQSAYDNTLRFEPIYKVAPKFKNLFSENKPQPVSIDLSLEERGRLERAFYRFELYCRIWPHRWHWQDDDVRTWPWVKAERAVRRYGLFGENWQPWETAEMMAVNAHLNRKIHMRIWRLNRELSAAVMGAPGVQVVPADMTRKNFLKLNPELRLVDDLHQKGMHIYSHLNEPSLRDFARRRTERISYAAVSKGLKFVSELESSDVPTFKKMVRVDRPGLLEWRRLDEEFFIRSQVAFGDQPLANGQRNPIWLNTAVSTASNEDGVLCGTFGFRKYYRDILSGFSGRPNVTNPRLALMATPFWSAERMLTPEFVTAYKEVHNTKQTRNDQYDLEYSTFTAERYLKGIAIPVEHLHRIQKNFGYIPPLRSKQSALNFNHARQSGVKSA